MFFVKSNTKSTTIAGVAAISIVLALSACSRSTDGSGGGIFNRNKQETTQLEQPQESSSRWSKFRDRFRNLGRRGDDATAPAPVGSLPTLNPTVVDTPSVQQPSANLPVNTGVNSVSVTEANMNWTPAATRDYNGQYKRDANNKTFALSPDGAYGVSFGYASSDEASAAALRQCRADLKPGQLDCVVFDVNGQIVLLLPADIPRI